MAGPVNPVKLEVLRHALQAVAEEMGAVLTRTALSPNIKDRRDCSTAVYTPDGRLVAQAEHIPLHLGLMPAVVKAVLADFPAPGLSPGDVVMINDPYVSGSHLPDICLLSPVFYRQRPLALVANLAHHVDVGGSVPGSMSTTATEIFQEGLRIPPLLLRRAGQLNEELLRLLTHNVRTAGEFAADIRAQLNANELGAGRLQELAGRYGADVLQRYMEAMMDYAERRLLAALEGMPAGVYDFEDYLEGDGLSRREINIRVRLQRHSGGLTVDFTGTHPQVAGPVNATRGVTLACVYYVVKAVLDPGLPSNDGLVRSLQVITPPGSLVNPAFPAPVAHANINTAQRIADVLLGALSGALPLRVTAAGTGSMSNFTVGGLDAAGRYYSYVETCGGGQGAKYGQDGMDGVHVHMTNTRNTPVEVIELSYPLRVERYALASGSGGPGKYRGGLGLVREITVLGEEATVAVSSERAVHPPWGLAGGRPGERARVALLPPAESDPAPVVAAPGNGDPGKFTARVPAGSRVILQTAGGGGYGDPLERDPALVQLDVAEGLLSRDAAREDYGVVLTAELTVDEAATECLRRKIRD
ncbi:hydantoinase B/oxoprolinase family protein [Desulfotomaculum copahuensis]|uniref:5-oxoprolinase n=1 Tax=Desulfotomaculum copahuensis TaxID=1838280 RepID=A0A1B7LGK9_9FIRM|nr:hydantoinase B/oxoprolinase family protein [Desulfotomaculum copahuensis]OAT85224.1 5-oxoprolinase [Desulfotomaculum copahuensis]